MVFCMFTRGQFWNSSRLRGPGAASRAGGRAGHGGGRGGRRGSSLKAGVGDDIYTTKSILLLFTTVVITIADYYCFYCYY